MEGIIRQLESMIDTLQRFCRDMLYLLGSLIAKPIENMVVQVANALTDMKNLCVQFVVDIATIVWILCRIVVFYLPAIIILLTTKQIIWLLGAVVWIVAVTVIAFTYKK